MADIGAARGLQTQTIQTTAPAAEKGAFQSVKQAKDAVENSIASATGSVADLLGMDIQSLDTALYSVKEAVNTVVSSQLGFDVELTANIIYSAIDTAASIESGESAGIVSGVWNFSANCLGLSELATVAGDKAIEACSQHSEKLQSLTSLLTTPTSIFSSF